VIGMDAIIVIRGDVPFGRILLWGIHPSKYI